MRHTSPLLRPLPRRAARIALALALVLGAAGCETLEKFNMFGDGKKKLPGTRQQVFPEGVPGVDYSSNYGQPSNANATIEAMPAAGPPTGGSGQ